MKTFDEVQEWIEGAEAEFGDPAEAVGQMFFRYQPIIFPRRLIDYEGAELVFGYVQTPAAARIIELLLSQGISHEVRVVCGEPLIGDRPDNPSPLLDPVVHAYGLTKVSSGLWALNPSFNIPGRIHVFVVLYGVPDPAPWERL